MKPYPSFTQHGWQHIMSLSWDGDRYEQSAHDKEGRLWVRRSYKRAGYRVMDIFYGNHHWYFGRPRYDDQNLLSDEDYQTWLTLKWRPSSPQPEFVPEYEAHTTDGLVWYAWSTWDNLNGGFICQIIEFNGKSYRHVYAGHILDFGL